MEAFKDLLDVLFPIRWILLVIPVIGTPAAVVHAWFFGKPKSGLRSREIGGKARFHRSRGRAAATPVDQKGGRRSGMQPPATQQDKADN